MATETEFKVWFRGQWKGWSEAYEPRRGGGTGVPDIQILMDDQLLPVELKLGEVRDGRVFADDFQPAQVSWHARFWQAGGVAIFIVGIHKSQFVGGHPNAVMDWWPIKLPPVDVAMLLGREQGWDLKQCEPWTRWLP